MSQSVMPTGSMVDFAIVDVFADRPLTGNPLAVVPDADHLSEDQMRAIAREFNQSETTFLLRPRFAGADQRLRSFTAAGHEVGGAGHNALGAWLWLAQTGRFGVGSFRQEIADDVLDIDVEHDVNGDFRVVMAQGTPQFRATIERRAPLAAALGIDVADLDETLPTQVVSTGAGHLLVPLVNRETVDRVSVDAARLREILASCGGEGAYVYTTARAEGDAVDGDSVDGDAADGDAADDDAADDDAADGDAVDDDSVDGDAVADAYARFFNPTMGIVEDPATGTAAGPLAALLAAQGRVADGDVVVIDQGHAIGRPSRLRVTVSGEVVRLSGGGLTVAEGRLAVGW